MGAWRKYRAFIVATLFVLAGYSTQVWAQNAPSTGPKSTSKAFESAGIKASIVRVNIDTSNRYSPRIAAQLAIQNTRAEGLYLNVLGAVPASDDTGTNYFIQSVSGMPSCGDGYTQANLWISTCEQQNLKSFDDYTFIDPGQVAVITLNYQVFGTPSQQDPNTFSFALRFFALLGTKTTDVLDPLKKKGNPGKPTIVTINFPLITVK